MGARKVVAVASVGLRAPGSRVSGESRRVYVTGAGHVQLLSPALDIDVKPRNASDVQAVADSLNGEAARFLIGDESQNGARASTEGAAANLVVVDYDGSNCTVRVSASLLGLPPVYTAVDGESVRLSVPSLTHEWLHEAPRPLDADAVLDHLCWGYPVSHRTVYSGIRLASAASTLEIQGGSLQVRDADDDAEGLIANWDAQELVEREVRAFDQSVKRMDVTGAFLSVSGGLDSRAILQALCANSMRVPCVTIASSGRSLDCRNAGLACRAAGVPHEAVVLGEEYHRHLPDLFWEAARLTGGLGALSQTVDVYLYRQLKGRYRRRISGNLGNQVARAGFERLSMPRLDSTILSKELRQQAESSERQSPWFVARMAEQGVPKILFREEVPFSSAGNYSLGSEFAIQLAPYADSQLIKLSTIRNRDAISVDSRLFRAHLRGRDLRHRMSGPPILSSFQRQYINTRVARSRQTPVNFGWRSSGGMDLRRAALLARVGVSMLASRLPVSQHLDALLRRTGLHPRDYWGLSTWHSSMRWSLRDSVLNVIQSRELGESKLFDSERLKEVVLGYLERGVGDSELVGNILEVGAALRVSREIAEQCRRSARLVTRTQFAK